MYVFLIKRMDLGTFSSDRGTARAWAAECGVAGRPVSGREAWDSAGRGEDLLGSLRVFLRGL